MTGLQYDNFYVVQTFTVLDGFPNHPHHSRLQFSEPKTLGGTDERIDPTPKDRYRAPSLTPI